MDMQNRRAFLQTSAGALAFGLVPGADASEAIAAFRGMGSTSDSKQTAPVVASNAGKKPLRLGLIIAVEKNPDVTMRKLVDLGLYTAQLYIDDLDPKNAAHLRQSLEKHKIEATALVVGGPSLGLLWRTAHDRLGSRGDSRCASLPYYESFRFCEACWDTCRSIALRIHP